MIYPTNSQGTNLSLLADDSRTIATLCFQNLARQIIKYVEQLKQRLELDASLAPTVAIIHSRQQRQLHIECRGFTVLTLELQGCCSRKRLSIDSAEQQVIFFDRTVAHGHVLLNQKDSEDQTILTRKLCTEAQARFALLSEAKIRLASQVGMDLQSQPQQAAYS